MSVETIRLEEVEGHPLFASLGTLPQVAVELRYATSNNFAGYVLYEGAAFDHLRVEALRALAESASWLERQRPGYRLLVLDALRPQRVQEKLHAEVAGTPEVIYLADPRRGSIHSFGMAVDVTLLDRAGAEVDMGSAFDAMTPLSHTDREAELLARGALSAMQLTERGWLRSAMREGGFLGISTEWWHFDLGDRERVRAQFPRVL